MASDGVLTVSPGPDFHLVVLGLGNLSEPTIHATLEQVTQFEDRAHRAGVYLVTAGGDGAFPPGLVCYYDAATGHLGLWDHRTGDIEPYGGTDAPAGWPLAFTLSARSSIDPNTVDGPPRCAARNAVGVEESRLPVDRPEPVAQAQVGLWTHDGGATFSSVTVIDRRP